MKKTVVIVDLVTITIFAVVLFISCKKDSSTSCFDAALQQQSIGLFCTMDCPGVKGCDGKTYCNACIAAKAGIRVKQ